MYNYRTTKLAYLFLTVASKKNVDNKPPLTYDVKGTHFGQLKIPSGDAQTKLAGGLGPQFYQLHIPDVKWQVASAWEQSSSGFQGIALVGRARDGSVIVSRFLVTPASEDSEYPSWSISTSKLGGEPKVDTIIHNMNNNAHFGIKSIKGSPWVGGYPNEHELKKIKGKKSLPELLTSAGFGSPE